MLETIGTNTPIQLSSTKLKKNTPVTLKVIVVHRVVGWGGGWGSFVGCVQRQKDRKKYRTYFSSLSLNLTKIQKVLILCLHLIT